MSHQVFQFKQFFVNQDRCAMKIGTDGVLLGAWVSVKQEPHTVLDIGAGTGVIALMLAQRCFAETIEGIEIDALAYEQCVENFEGSPWADRLFCYHAGLDEFVDEIEDTYDLIVSNPPFYAENVSSGTKARDIARQNSALPFEELLQGVASLLSKDGLFATIIPHKEEEGFMKYAASVQLFPERVLRVKGNQGAEVKRSLIEFSKKPKETLVEELIIEQERHIYTDAYKALTKDFYLKM